MSSPNPYTPMLLTYNARRFYGRENEISSILQVITASEPGGHAIYGIRTIGKTTLLKYLKDKNGALKHYEKFVNAEYRVGGDRRLFFVYVNFHIFSEGESIFSIMMAQLDEDLQNDEMDSLVQVPPYDDETSRQELVNGLRRTLQKLGQHGVRVVFLLDDFDAPLESIDGHDDSLLRTLSDYAALIIATEEPISELRPDFGASSPLLGILRPESLSLLNDRSARELICNPANEVGRRFTEEEEDFLIHIAGRQPFLLTAACELYFEMHSEYPDLSNLLHDRLQRDTLQIQFLSRLGAASCHARDAIHLSRLRPEEHRTLYNMTTTVKLDMTGEPGKIAARLANKGVVYWDVKQSVYCIFSLLFRDFVTRSYAHGADKTLAKPVTEKMPYDNLTPIDGALLRYFTDHRNRVCTFDELLDAVWQDGEKSKRALEAAVHRLRKNLAPGEAIKNVRGIGYKFVSARSMPNGTLETM